MACRKDKPVKWSAVAKSGDADIMTTQCEAYGLAGFGHEYEEIPTSEMTIIQAVAMVILSWLFLSCWEVSTLDLH